MSAGRPRPDGGDPARDGGWRAVLFDLDGTLADTVDLILRSYRHTMRRHLGHERPDQEWIGTMGTPLQTQLRDFARDEEEAAAMLDTYTSFQRRVHDDLVRPYPGASTVVDGLLERRIRLAVVTSKRREMAIRTLRVCGFDGRFTVLITADDVVRAKPDPEPVHRALEGLGIDPGPDILFVGDSPWDMQAGRAAGIRTAAALWGPYPWSTLEAADPDFLVREIGEVAALGAD